MVPRFPDMPYARPGDDKGEINARVAVASKPGTAKKNRWRARERRHQKSATTSSTSPWPTLAEPRLEPSLRFLMAPSRGAPAIRLCQRLFNRSNRCAFFACVRNPVKSKTARDGVTRKDTICLFVCSSDRLANP